MITSLSVALSAACGVAALWTLALIVANRPMLLDRTPTRAFLGALAVLEVGLLGQAVVSCVAVLTSDATLDGASLVGYALTLPLVLPIVLVWGLNDRSRWGAGVVLIGLVTVPLLILRMTTIWDARG